MPVGKSRGSKDVDSLQARKVVDWMKAAYSGSLLEFERLWRQNFLEKMGPKHLPVTWSLERMQRAHATLPSDLSVAKSASYDQKKHSESNPALKANPEILPLKMEA